MAASGTSYNGTVTSGNDKLVGGSGSDIISAGAGNDSVNGGSGNDIVNGGSGFDTVLGGSGSDILIYKAFENKYVLNSSWSSTTATKSGGQVYTGTDEATTLSGAWIIPTSPTSSTGAVVNGTAQFGGYDSYDGGNGSPNEADALQIWLSAEQLADPAIRAEIEYYKNTWLPQHKLGSGQGDNTFYTFKTLNLKVSAIEKVEIRNWNGSLDISVSPPSKPDLVSASDSGSSQTDNKTKDNTPTVSGGGAEAGATVTLYDTNGTTVLGTAVADASGNWSITSVALADGDHTLKVKQTDSAGNTSLFSGGLTVTIDTQAAAPSTPDLVSTSDSGSSSTDKEGTRIDNCHFPVVKWATGRSQANGLPILVVETVGGTQLAFQFDSRNAEDCANSLRTAADPDHSAARKSRGTSA